MIVCLDKGARAAPVSVEVDGGWCGGAIFEVYKKGFICARKIFDTSTWPLPVLKMKKIKKEKFLAPAKLVK